MIPVVRSIVGVMVGLMAAVLFVAVGDAMSSLIAPPPAGLDLKDTAAMGAYVESLPVTALIVMLAGHAVGALMAGMLAARIAGRARFAHAAVVGLLFLIAGVLNLWLIPFHPLWFEIVDVLVYLPAALMGACLAPVRPRSFATN